MLALGYIAEQVTGISLADLVASTITEPAGLDDSFLSDGTDLPDNYQHGRFFLEGVPVHSTAEVPAAAGFTYAPAEAAFVSTVPDLLDLLDTWVDGTWRPARRHRHQPRCPPTASWTSNTSETSLATSASTSPTPDTARASRRATATASTPSAGRPATFGTDVHLFHYLDDDFSIVLHYNSNTSADRSQIEAVLADIRATVAASI